MQPIKTPPSGPQKAARHRVTINDLAQTLGLTKGTVSRALNNYPDIADSTRLRVKRAAETLGYRPLSHAQAIRTGRTRSIGLVLQTWLPDAHRPFLAEFLGGLTQQASTEGWTLTVATASSDDDVLATLDRLIEERKADGFVLPRTLALDPRVDLLRREEVPFVLFGRVANSEGCAWFDMLGEDAIRDAVLRLHGLGHQRIGFVNAEPAYNFARLREQGYRTGLRRAGLPTDTALIRRDAMTRDHARRATHDLLDLPNPPTAIIYALDLAALGGYDAAAARGMVVGRDLSVIGYDGIPEGAHMTPPLTTFNVDLRRCGHRLADLLIRRIRGEAAEDLRELAPADLIARGSDRPPGPALASAS